MIKITRFQFVKDRFVRGSIAGFLAGIIMDLVSYGLVRGLNFGEDLMRDYMAEMLIGRKPVIPFEAISSLAGHIMFTGFLGVVFSYLLLLFGSRYILYKGWCYSIAIWFILYSFGILFEVPLLATNTASTVTAHAITATIYGLLLAAIIAYFEKAAAE
jgi:hypothetical protein